MSKNAITSEDLYPDNVDTHMYHGIPARKGTMAAIIANIELLESENSSADEKEGALQQLKKDAPVVIATGLYKQVIWKNKQVQEIMDETAVELKDIVGE